jgi:hypothetical protein
MNGGDLCERNAGAEGAKDSLGSNPDQAQELLPESLIPARDMDASVTDLDSEGAVLFGTMHEVTVHLEMILVLFGVTTVLWIQALK